MMHDACTNAAPRQHGIYQRGTDQVRIIVFGDAPTDNPARAQVHDRRQISPPQIAQQIRGIVYPDLIAMFGPAQFTQQVGTVSKQVSALGAARLVTRPLLGLQSEFAHQTQGAVTAAPCAIFDQMRMDRPISIPPSGLRMDRLDLLLDEPIRLLPDRWFERGPTVVSLRDSAKAAHISVKSNS